MKKYFSLFILLTMSITVMALPALVKAEDGEATSVEAGASSAVLNAASSEATEKVKYEGTLIEIGNTTSSNTTLVVRVIVNGANKDLTIEVNSQTAIHNGVGNKSDLSDWIAGDRVYFEGVKNTNSGEIIASRIRNRTMNQLHRGVNGWIKSIDTANNKAQVEWGRNVYTLDLSAARLVAGLKNPAAIGDLQAGDRVRARVTDDRDGNANTWKADTLVVLRRGDTLFMRVTRWVVPATIIEVPDTISADSNVIKVEVRPNRFYQKGDVNNLVGAPGTKLEVKIASTTQLKRKFMGNAILSEFSEGDMVNIVGRLNETTGQLDALIIKNNSIQVLGVASKLGTVESVDAAKNEIKASLGEAKTYTIRVQSGAKIQKRGSSGLSTITINDIKAGDKIRVRGTLNRRQLTITAREMVVLEAKVKTKDK